MKCFELTYYYGPDESLVEREEIWRDMHDAGITLAQLRYSVRKNKTALLFCEKYGIRANVWDERIRDAIKAEDAQACDAIIAECVRDYAPYRACVGFDIVDEPSCRDFAGLGRVVDACRRYAPDYESVINLFPNYATPELLGCLTYEEHIRRYMDEVRPTMLSYDHYHFLKDEERGEVKADLGREHESRIFENAHSSRERDGFFENADIIRRAAREAGIDAMMIALLIEHGPYRRLTREELSYEASVCLAYGFRRMSYFTYGLPKGDDDFWHWQHAMIDNEGTRDEHFYDVEAISQWLLPLGRHLFSLDCERVVHTDREALSHGRIRALSGAAVVGCYSDGSVLIANKSFDSEAHVTLDADSLERYLPKEDTFVPSDRVIVLSAGACALVR